MPDVGRVRVGLAANALGLELRVGADLLRRLLGRRENARDLAAELVVAGARA